MRQSVERIEAAGGLERPSPEKGFLQDVLTGLRAEPKRISPKYFYDETGSALFDEICDLEEYYPFRAELALLPQVAEALRPRLLGSYNLIEFGAGSLRKVQPLLSTLGNIRRFTAIDISGAHLERACARLAAEHPGLQVDARVADFCEEVALPQAGQRIGFFPGSTIGNLAPSAARDFLRKARGTLGRGSYFLLGVDTKKSPQRLHRAYNDSHGVTAAFNRNILDRINRELAADFQVERFEHYACYNPIQGRVEMHLISTRRQQVTIAGTPVAFAAGESIHTENSYKYTVDEFSSLAASAGWRMERCWMAEADLFAIYLLSHDRGIPR